MITRTSTTNAFRRAPRVGVDDNRIGIHVEPRRNRIGIRVKPAHRIRVKPAHRNPCQTRASESMSSPVGIASESISNRASDPSQTRASESVSNPRIGIRVKPAHRIHVKPAHRNLTRPVARGGTRLDLNDAL